MEIFFGKTEPKCHLKKIISVLCLITPLIIDFAYFCYFSFIVPFFCDCNPLYAIHENAYA